jgi:hypothetical protein
VVDLLVGRGIGTRTAPWMAVHGTGKHEGRDLSRIWLISAQGR